MLSKRRAPSHRNGCHQHVYDPAKHDQYLFVGEALAGGTRFDRLSRHRIYRTSCPDLEFVQYHVSQALVVYDTYVDVCSELLACNARVHGLVAIVIISGRQKLVAEVVQSGVFFRKSVCADALKMLIMKGGRGRARSQKK